MAINRLTRPTFGLPHKFVRQLYRSVVIPKMEYGLCVWYSPIVSNGTKHRKGSVGFLMQLGLLPRRSPPRIPPPHHPLHSHVKRCMHMYPQAHRSVLHEMFHAFPVIRSLETIDPTPLDTTWVAPFTFRIADNKDMAIEELAQYTGGACLYGDGSGYEGGAGGAAVLKNKDGVYGMLRLHLGPMEKHTVFEAELVGLILCLVMIADTPRLRAATILIDNQAAIHLPDLRKKRRTFKLHIAWIPGHKDVEGNEAVDAEAKTAAQGESSVLPHALRALHHLPSSMAALKAAHKKHIARVWHARCTPARPLPDNRQPLNKRSLLGKCKNKGALLAYVASTNRFLRYASNPA
ncbi:hypothetical protein B0H17DRAFT_1203812 [Mycena rosella]|uniref:RNase H type-1 domain-containing protein n=1 Tax=Mycena rosella TaxID=1033263 RepID=A0AAD7DB45_MYCRO|nr:hypothetical protein B0H17DRAFT_1203812 [Mycena rosella]